MDYEKYMLEAIKLAKLGTGFVNPNPLVGCVIVKDNIIISSGYHEKYGEYHAERNAIYNLKNNNSIQEITKGATLYVTLEPCSHYGKTPPCSEIIIESGIKKVVIGSLDANPLVNGKGIESLKNAGIEVITGILEKECQKLNEVFFNFIKNKKPFVVMKYAMTLDGKITTSTGKSKWITSSEAREDVHIDRHKYMAIMVGINTVLFDDPMLSCRAVGLKNPIRIICDTNLKMPLTSNIVKTASSIKTIIATSISDENLHLPFINSGCDIAIIKKTNGHIDLNILMNYLYEKKIDSIYLEGGATLNFSALQSKIINKVKIYIAPKIFGGNLAKTPVGGYGIDEVYNAIKITNKEVYTIGEDIVIEGEVLY